MARKNKEAPEQGRFGIFITMMVGLLVFFGMVSRLQDLSSIGPDRPVTEPDPLEEAQQKLEEERARALVVFGSRNPAPFQEAEDAAPVEQPARTETRQEHPEATPQRTEPRRQTPRETPRSPRPLDQKKYHVVKDGDSLWSIATKAFGDGKQYKKIIDANPGLDPNSLEVGRVLVIPSDADGQPARR